MSKIRHLRPSEGELHAYVDGSLAASRVVRVERYLEANPAVAERILDYHDHKSSLTALLDRLPFTPEPASVTELRESLAKATRRQRTFQRSALAGMAAAATLALFVSGWWARDYYPPGEAHLVSLTRQAAEAHLLFAGDEELPRVASDNGGRSLFEWLAHRTTGRTLDPPDLAAVGFGLVNGWLVSTRRGPAVQLLYRDKDGRTLTFYASAEGPTSSTAFSFSTVRDLSIFYWKVGGVSYSIAARLERAKLLAIAEIINEELGSALKEGPAPDVDRAPGPAQSDQKREASAAAPAAPAVPVATETAPDATVDASDEKAGVNGSERQHGAPPEAPPRQDKDATDSNKESGEQDIRSGTIPFQLIA